MRLTFLATVAALVGMFGSQASADNFPFVGNQLYDWCRMADTSEDESVQMLSKGLCAGYIGGVADTLATANSGCLEKGTRLEQIIDLVKLYLTNHPESRHYTAASLVISAIAEKFPCAR